MCHRLNVHVHHDKQIYRLVGCDPGVVQVVLDVGILEKLTNLLNFDLQLCL